MKGRESKKERVCPRLHQQFKPLISPPQHPSVLHPVLFTPHLSPSISHPPPNCVTMTTVYSSWVTLTTLISLHKTAVFLGGFFLLLLLLLPFSFLTGCHAVQPRLRLLPPVGPFVSLPLGPLRVTLWSLLSHGQPSLPTATLHFPGMISNHSAYYIISHHSCIVLSSLTKVLYKMRRRSVKEEGS